MKAQEVVTRTMVYSSEVVTDISTTDEALREVIVWADANPVVWKIVMGTKSGTFGRNASTYVGYVRGTSPESALLRAEALKRMLEVGHSFFRWRVEFTLKRYREKGFCSGFFRQHDTAGLGWCDAGAKFETKHVTIDEKIVRLVAAPKKGAVSGP